VSVGSQQSSPSPNPCQVEVAAARLETQAKAARLVEAEQALAESDRNLSASRGISNSLAIKNKEQEAVVDTLRQSLTIVLAEKRQALRKIKKANGRWHCELLKIGCVR
jgi:hypothetical protein